MYIDGVKFACEACIRGHRQASCSHADRPLREIARRGRPVTACAHCRELRKMNNSHRTCSHQERADVPDVLLKTLPNGANDLQSFTLVRRASSARSHSSISSAAPSAASVSQRTTASTGAKSTASTPDQDLATVGRKKSLSRPASVSRRSSSARDKKPHDLAHGHLADHPTHVSSVYSPYPQHGPKEHHHAHPHHHHSPPGPSPLSKGAERSASADAAQKAKLLAEGMAEVLPVPSTSTLSLPRLPSLAAPTPPRSNSAPIPPSAPGLVPPAVASPQPPGSLTTEQLASAYFFRDLPPESEAFAAPPVAASLPNPALQAYFDAPVLRGPDAGPDGAFGAYSAALAAPGGPTLTLADVDCLSTSPTFSLPEIDPEAAAFVLGPAGNRTAVALAPMFGEGEDFYPELESTHFTSAASEVPLYSFASTSSTSADPSAAAWAPQDYPPPASSAASSDIHELRPPHPALYGYPLEPVASHTLSSYSSASASIAPSISLSATSAFERLDLDFGHELDLDRAHLSSASASHSARATPPSAAGSHAPAEEAQAQQATDLDGILEWLASASGGPPPPAPPLRTDSASSSGVQSAWPSAPPSAYGASGQEEDESPPAPVTGARVAFDATPAGARSAFETIASGEEEEEIEEEGDDDERGDGDNDLEMLRTATITCCDPSASASASASHSSDEGGWAEGGGGAIDEPFSLADLDLERFGVDEEWLRSLGLFGAPAHPEGEGDEDDGYEEDDEASIIVKREGGDGDEDEEDNRGWTEEDWVAAPTPAPDPHAEDEDADAVVKDEAPPDYDQRSVAPTPDVAIKPEDDRERDEHGFSRGELWWS
ncbi:copper-binding transcription factor [Rhodotorula kratochvilovae]